MDEVLRILAFEHRTRAAFARLGADPQQMEDYQDEARSLAEVDAEVVD